MLKGAIESALTQDYQNLEVVISDNASTDDTPQIVKEFNDPRIKYFRNSVNIGAFLNFRKLVYERAKGEYAILLGDDDYYIDDSYISKAVELLEKNNKLVMVFSNWRRDITIGEDKYENYILQLPPIISGQWIVLNYYTKQPNDLTMIFQLYTAVFRRELAVKVDAISANYLNGDVTMICKLCVNGDVGFVKTISLARKIHKDNISRTAKYEEWFDNMFRVGIDVADYLKEKGLPIKSINKLKRRCLRIDLRSMIIKTLLERVRRGPEFRPSLWRLIKKIYNEDPFLLVVFFRPRVTAQMFLSLNPVVYNYFRKRYSRESLYMRRRK